MADTFHMLQSIALYIAMLLACLSSVFALRKDKDNQLNASILTRSLPITMMAGRLAFIFWGTQKSTLQEEKWVIGCIIGCFIGIEWIYWRWLRPEFDILPYGRGAGTFFIAGVLLQTMLFASIMALISPTQM